MAEPDLLFPVRNHFYLGAYQAAIAEASDLEGLADAEKVERDCYVYRSYIELGSYEVTFISFSYKATTSMLCPRDDIAFTCWNSIDVKFPSRFNAGVLCLQLVINEVTDSSPQALQAVKLLALYLGKKTPKVGSLFHHLAIAPEPSNISAAEQQRRLIHSSTGKRTVDSGRVGGRPSLRWQCNHPLGGRDHLRQRRE